jgi:hypothetical protein
MDNISRQEQHKKYQELENIFPELEKVLGDSEKSILDQFYPKKY